RHPLQREHHVRLPPQSVRSQMARASSQCLHRRRISHGLLVRLIAKVRPNLIPVYAIAFLHAAYLAFFSSEDAVREASRTYARQLLLSIESPHLAAAKAAP